MLNDDAHGSNNFLTVNNSVIDGSYLADMDMMQTDQGLLLMVRISTVILPNMLLQARHLWWQPLVLALQI